MKEFCDGRKVYISGLNFNRKLKDRDKKLKLITSEYWLPDFNFKRDSVYNELVSVVKEQKYYFYITETKTDFRLLIKDGSKYVFSMKFTDYYVMFDAVLERIKKYMTANFVRDLKSKLPDNTQKRKLVKV